MGTDPPFSNELLTDIEGKLGVKLPAELKTLCAETNGIKDSMLCDIVFPAGDLVSKNIEMRTEEMFEDLFMPFDYLLFFGAWGNGSRPSTCALGAR